MITPIKTYYESKKRALLYGLIVFVPLMLIVLNETFNSYNGFNPTFLTYTAIFVLCFGIYVYFLPVGVLEIYTDSFMYKKGKSQVVSPWSEVNVIAFQVGKSRGGSIPSSFIIDSKNGTTKLIDIRSLKQKGIEDTVNLIQFIDEIESVSGQTVKWGETSIQKYSEVSFKNYLKGAGF